MTARALVVESGHYINVTDIAFGPSGQVYVSDGLDNRVVELSYNAPAPADATGAASGTTSSTAKGNTSSCGVA